MSTTNVMLKVCVLFLGLLIGSAAQAATKKADKAGAKEPAAAAATGEVTLKGTMVCGKCSLKQADACQNVLKVTEKDKEVVYWLEHNDVAKSNHGPVCSGSKGATVKGAVSDKDGKKLLTANSITYE